MSASAPQPPYAPVVVPALHRIQHQFGYLQSAAMEQFSQQSGIPMARLQAVGSFFPHFRFKAPPKVSVHVCRDMACQMAGSRQTTDALKRSFPEGVEVHGVSCLGRCDRAPAACLSTAGDEHESYHLGRSATELEGIVRAALQGSRTAHDSDARDATNSPTFQVDPYEGKPCDYAGVGKVVIARNNSILAASKLAAEKFQLGPHQLEAFRQKAVGEDKAANQEDAKVNQAVLDWQSDSDWAKGKELGGWSEAILTEFEAADLRGMGGAGIPVSQKLRDVRDAVRTARVRGTDIRAFVVVNGDESEPGTFKDREILLHTPHLVVEAVIMAGLVTGASQGFIYIRHEYTEQIEACRAEILRAEELGMCGRDAPVLGRPFPVSVFVSPGGYICGEQSALIEAMSDRRGEPRNMPPKLETNGLQDLPTIVSNVETYAWMPYIFLRSGATYAGLGVNGWKGRRFFSISGDVKKPGVYEVPMGMTLRELVYGEDYCGGIVNDLPMKAFAPSGPSGGFLPAKLKAGAGLPRDHVNNKAWIALAGRRGIDPASPEIDILDLELELNLFRALSPTQALGAGLVVYAEGRDMAEQALYSMEFYRNESCGKCVPCRLGSQKMTSLAASLLAGKIDATTWKEELVPMMKDLLGAIEMSSICGLGRSVPAPLRTLMNFFPADVTKHLTAPKASPQLNS
ncbi:MAG: NAD(P)H-dependent oxidoreductase subunit E [Chthoniobacteraceae bacterium]|nr:NAD(P)H-dependent oxidoreductase subunit E [Chthoniobacteraceae bacterium]